MASWQKEKGDTVETNDDKLKKLEARIAWLERQVRKILKFLRLDGDN